MSVLILLCGTPRSGKTTIAEKLRSLLQAEDRTVLVISDGDTSLSLPSSTTTTPDTNTTTTTSAVTTAVTPKSELYKDAKAEKQTRSQLRSLVERGLSIPRTVIILDSLNYIKGFRYELYCVAKTANASYLVIHTDTPLDVCISRDVDDLTPGNKIWGETLHKELASRFEPPNPSNRWDRPLFTIQHQTTTTNVNTEETLNQIVSSLNTKKKSGSAFKLKPTMATRFQVLPTVDAVADIDTATRQAEAALVSALRSGNKHVGDTVPIPGSTLSIRLQRKPLVSELRDMRRAFLNYSRMHPPASSTTSSSLVDGYVQYINEQLTVIR